MVYIKENGWMAWIFRGGWREIISLIFWWAILIILIIWLVVAKYWWGLLIFIIIAVFFIWRYNKRCENSYQLRKKKIKRLQEALKKAKSDKKKEIMTEIKYQKWYIKTNYPK